MQFDEVTIEVAKERVLTALFSAGIFHPHAGHEGLMHRLLDEFVAEISPAAATDNPPADLTPSEPPVEPISDVVEPVPVAEPVAEVEAEAAAVEEPATVAEGEAHVG